IQMDIALGDPEANYEHAAALIKQAVSAEVKPDVIVLPEMWNTGYKLERIGEIADRDGRRTKEMFAELARETGTHIIAGSIADLDGEQVRNTAYAFDRQGKLHADYSKIHLFRLMHEEKYLTAGDHLGL